MNTQSSTATKGEMGMGDAHWLVNFANESNRIEGMDAATRAERDALAAFLSLPVITVADIEAYVGVIAPGHKLRREVGRNVRVGRYIAPAGGPEIEEMLVDLLEESPSLTPFEAHIDYEKLHPFTDGNGRSGRAVWLWNHMRQGTAERPKAIGFLHTFYYETLSAAP